jgi:hypothetical protein
MDTFFSGTDISQLKDRGKNENYFLMLICNKKGTFSSKLVIPCNVEKPEKKLKVKSENTSFEVNLDEKNFSDTILASFNVDVYLEVNEEVDETFITRVEKVEKDKKNRVVVYTPTSTYASTYNYEYERIIRESINKLIGNPILEYQMFDFILCELIHKSILYAKETIEKNILKLDDFVLENCFNHPYKSQMIMEYLIKALKKDIISSPTIQNSLSHPSYKNIYVEADKLSDFKEVQKMYLDALENLYPETAKDTKVVSLYPNEPAKTDITYKIRKVLSEVLNNAGKKTYSANKTLSENILFYIKSEVIKDQKNYFTDKIFTPFITSLADETFSKTSIKGIMDNLFTSLSRYDRTDKNFKNMLHQLGNIKTFSIYDAYEEEMMNSIIENRMDELNKQYEKNFTD